MAFGGEAVVAGHCQACCLFGLCEIGYIRVSYRRSSAPSFAGRVCTGFAVNIDEC